MFPAERIMSINRHRLGIDGDGVTTLVAFHGCPLRCRYCLNPRCLGPDEKFRIYTPAELFAATCIDELYFLASGGGITFGGGEPALRPEFIKEFREICGEEWKLNIETSLNVPEENINRLLDVTDFFIIDIKDINNDIYKSYTGQDNSAVISNLKVIAGNGRANDCLIRLPLIPGYNTDGDRDKSLVKLKEMGFTNFDLFNYIIKPRDEGNSTSIDDFEKRESTSNLINKLSGHLPTGMEDPYLQI